ncbi:uncharacterized protein LOC123555723 [Mercenaria mercenaria]|uniref:uncharacterized protein LOC123555723 n=1 Tax=Mercenaria mercenaria TaxID=6596 RepID=UPI00234EA1C0|nr:uncharacterized protein LOC123555723 [Mercenaria mercenaria]
MVWWWDQLDYKLGLLKVYRETIYVAPIAKDMLLGFDLLHSKAVLDMRRGIINFDGEDLNQNVDKASGEPLVARVTLCKRNVVPPNSVMQVKCHVNRAMSVFMIEPDEVPGHLEEVYAKSTTHLDDEQKSELRKLSVDYQDVFATSEFDLGNFTEIQHSIDTGTAKPIKQRMRRTPACFVAEEEAHLKMLEAGVIQESTSEWASAPVLIRKKDGTVRW